MNDPTVVRKMNLAIEFLHWHPAVNSGYSFLNAFDWWASEVCKNDCVKDIHEKPSQVLVRAYEKSKLYNKFKSKYAEIDSKGNYDGWIDIPYKEVYGYDWEFHKFKYCADFSIYRFIMPKNPTRRNMLLGYDLYQAYSGGYVTANSFEELIIECAKVVKKNYGNFRIYDFETKEEKENHSKEDCFLHLPSKLGEAFTELKHNPNYIDVYDGVLNLRWWDWYMKTDHFQKNWADTFKDMENNK